MPVEPPGKIIETPTIGREEGPGFQKRKKPKPPQEEPKEEPNKSGKVDIKI